MKPSPAHQPPGSMRTQMRLRLRDGLLPFHSGAPLAPPARRRVAAVWAVLGALISCAWSIALAFALGRGPELGTLLLVLVLVAGGALFFGGLGFLMVGFGNRQLARERQAGTPHSNAHERHGR